MGLLRKMWKERTAYLFLAPLFIAFTLFVFVPLIRTMLLTFQNGDLLSMRFVGLQNYKSVVNDSFFTLTLKNTLSYAAIVVPTVIVFSLILALCLKKILFRPLQDAFKAFIFFPLLSPVVISALSWQAMYHPQGLLNTIGAFFGLKARFWLGDPKLVLKSIAIVEIWRGAGFYVIVLLAALQGQPKEVYEAASIDGSHGFHTFRTITFPLLKPSLMFCSVMATIFNLQLFDLVYVMTGGGPAYRSSTIVWYIYENAFHYGQVGYAATMALLLMLIIMVLSMVQMKFFSSDD